MSDGKSLVKRNGDARIDAPHPVVTATRDWLASEMEANVDREAVISEALRRVAEQYPDRGALDREVATLRAENARLRRTVDGHKALFIALAVVVVYSAYKLGALGERIAALSI